MTEQTEQETKTLSKEERKAAKRAAKTTAGTIGDSGTIAKVAKEGKRRTLRVTIFAADGTAPNEVDVEPDDEGNFDVEDSAYTVERGSVWMGRDGVLRAIAKEGQPRTINAATIEGDAIMHPKVFHANIHRTVLSDFGDMARSRGMWRQAGTYGLIIVGVFLVLGIVWLTSTIGGGLEELRHALDGLEVQAAGESGPRTPAEEAGHQDISPGGKDA